MSDLISEHPDALAWVKAQEQIHADDRRFGSFVAGVLWIDEPGPDGEPIGGHDPQPLLAEINETGWPVLDQHDPGRPLGRVLAAKLFRPENGVAFAAQFLGMYAGGERTRFSELGVDVAAAAPSPTAIDTSPGDWWIQLARDPREYDDDWVRRLPDNPPLPLRDTELSHNAAEPIVELLRIGLPFLVLVWNPMVTTIGKEAGKDIYEGVRAWLSVLWENLKDRRNPVVVLHSNQRGCELMFVFRGTSVQELRAAHAALPEGAAHAEMLVYALNQRKLKPQQAVYEFESGSGWCPSYATLADGRLVSDRNVLVALEQSRRGLSMGISVQRGKDKLRRP